MWRNPEYFTPNPSLQQKQEEQESIPVEPLVHRSGGAGEGAEEDDGDDGEEKRDYHQIGEGARRHIRAVGGRLLLLPRRRSASSSPPAGLSELAKTPTQSGERSKRGWDGLLRRYLIPSRCPCSCPPKSPPHASHPTTRPLTGGVRTSPIPHVIALFTSIEEMESDTVDIRALYVLAIVSTFQTDMRDPQRVWNHAGLLSGTRAHLPRPHRSSTRPNLGKKRERWGVGLSEGFTGVRGREAAGGK
uniref:Uncharacterized protein n=1 Tax=Triticum aestivum TaxID=4565 RepID=A0A077RPE9_WHEAT|nr:unnamed protein product [Triticum aestivum]